MRHIEMIENEATRRGAYTDDIRQLENKRREGLKKRFVDGLSAVAEGDNEGSGGGREEL
eukprot:CAMPEP_0113557004 /NCGR_PEP_ID=MMETSP0015_2-20120614/17557_1 /TAXON_ID=2838 /ORGANISM="Odontella" /LENGTH=58 /DNA_ID=CAMNT_0000458395 /DNA_START=1185 /DNA_END=1361 /DNA_ORIENTATION=- /assembly_acc=CAM_ASM_000160